MRAFDYYFHWLAILKLMSSNVSILVNGLNVPMFASIDKLAATNASLLCYELSWAVRIRVFGKASVSSLVSIDTL